MTQEKTSDACLAESKPWKSGRASRARDITHSLAVAHNEGELGTLQASSRHGASTAMLQVLKKKSNHRSCSGPCLLRHMALQCCTPEGLRMDAPWQPTRAGAWEEQEHQGRALVTMAADAGMAHRRGCACTSHALQPTRVRGTIDDIEAKVQGGCR